MAILFNISFEGQLLDLVRIDTRIQHNNILRPALQNIAEDFRFHMRRAYKRSGTPGYKWPANSPRYVANDKLKGGNPPGVRTGAVRRSFITGKGRGSVEEYGSDNLRIGTSLKYANFSAAGPRRPRRGLVLDTQTQVFRGGEVRARRVPVRDPLLQVFTLRTRKLRKPIQKRWEGYLLEPIKELIENPVSASVTRPSRRRGGRRTNFRA